jgi:hypothetical protein
MEHANNNQVEINWMNLQIALLYPGAADSGLVG